MNRENAAKLAPMIAAYGEGKQIQVNTGSRDTPVWHDSEYLRFDEPAYHYRVKPDPYEASVLVKLDDYNRLKSERDRLQHELNAWTEGRTIHQRHAQEYKGLKEHTTATIQKLRTELGAANRTAVMISVKRFNEVVDERDTMSAHCAQLHEEHEGRHKKDQTRIQALKDENIKILEGLRQAKLVINTTLP